MKHLILKSAICLFLSNSLFSQIPPKTPKTPQTTSSSSTTKSSSYSVTYDTVDSEDNSSVSIKRNDNVYKFTARFHESKTGSLKKILVDRLGNDNLIVSNDRYSWIKKENGDKLYDCKLTEDTLKIYVDKEFANTTLVEMIEGLGLTLKDAISGTNSKEEARKNAESELKSAERELARAKRELERIKKEIKRNN